MARPVKHKAITELTESGQSVLFRGDLDTPRTVKRYAKRHGWEARVERQVEPDDVVAAALGHLWRVERL